MAKADIIAVLFLLALSFATSNGTTTEYASSTVSSQDETTISYVVTVSLENETPTVAVAPEVSVTSENEVTTVAVVPEVSVTSENEVTTVAVVPEVSVTSENEVTTVAVVPEVSVTSENEVTTVAVVPEVSVSSESEATTAAVVPEVSVSSENEVTTVAVVPEVSVTSENDATTVAVVPEVSVPSESETTTAAVVPEVSVTSENDATTVAVVPEVSVTSENEATTAPAGTEATASVQGGTTTVQPAPGVTTSSQDGVTTLPTIPAATTGAEGNTVVTEQITTAPPTSTSTTQTTPVISTTIPPSYQLPDFGAAPPFNMMFDIGFDKPWSYDFSDDNCSSNSVCSSFKRVVEIEINKAFEHCPGYINNSVAVVSFRNGSGSPSAQQRLRSSKYSRQSAEVDTQTTENNIYANYNTSFQNEQILGDSNAVIKDMDRVAESLWNADFNGTKALNDSLQTMTDTANYLITSYTESACSDIGMHLCTNDCFPCSEEDGLGYTVSCHNGCSEDEICTLTSKTAGCTCKANYLPVAGSCVDQNIIIGVSAGVGGAILLGLIIALIIVGCRLDKKDKDYDHLLKTQEYRPSTYEMTKVHDTAKGPEYTDIDLIKQSSADHDGHAMELTTFTNVVETDDSASIAAAAVVHAAGQHSAMDNAYQQVNESEAVRKDAAQEDMKPDYDYPSIAAAVVAAKSIEPESSSNQQNKPASSDHDRYRNLYYPQANDEDDPYAGFVPRLTMVDTKTEFLITRPKIALKPASNYKDINSQFF